MSGGSSRPLGEGYMLKARMSLLTTTEKTEVFNHHENCVLNHSLIFVEPRGQFSYILNVSDHFQMVTYFMETMLMITTLVALSSR